jgi:transposase
MLHAGLDLSRGKVDVCLISDEGEVVDEWASPPDSDGLRGLAARAAMQGPGVRGVIESMNGARFVHDQLEEHGWDVLIADAHKVKGLAPLACKTDKIDARVLAALSCRDLVPEIWLPDPTLRREREPARFRLHLVRHRTTLKNRIHATLITFGHPCPVSDPFGHAGRELLDRLAIPDPWRRNVDVSLALIDDLELQIARLTVQLKRQGADHRYIPLLVTAPGLGWINAYTIASEIGDITRFASPAKPCGYTGLCPRVHQSGTTDRRGRMCARSSTHSLASRLLTPDPCLTYTLRNDVVNNHRAERDLRRTGGSDAAGDPGAARPGRRDREGARRAVLREPAGDLAPPEGARAGRSDHARARGAVATQQPAGPSPERGDDVDERSPRDVGGPDGPARPAPATDPEGTRLCLTRQPLRTSTS